jgi:hypothetical protein
LLSNFSQTAASIAIADTDKGSPSEFAAASKGRPPFGVDFQPRHVYNTLFQVLLFVAAFFIVVSRRPDAVLNAQFFAEDGLFWFSDAYNLGIHSLLVPQASYLHTLTRLIALLSLLVPFSFAPLVMNLGAITVQVLPVNLFLSSRFSEIPMRLRLLASFLYLALPNTYEIDANITTLQWHLALLACLVLLAQPAIGWGWRIFDAVVLVLISLDGPTGLVLLPMAAAVWWQRRNSLARTNVALLVPGAILQLFSIFMTWYSRLVAPIGATPARLIIILGRQIFIPLLLGLKTTSRFLRGDTPHTVEVIATILGGALLLYALRYSPVLLKLFILFDIAVFGLCLVRPLAGAPDRPQWAWMCDPRATNRYYFLPMIAFLAALLWSALNRSHRKLRYLAVALLLLMPIGIYRDWKYPRFKDLNFKMYAAKFESAPSGTKMTIPINPGPPGWELEITKH